MFNITIRPARRDDRYALARIIVDATYSAFRGRAPDASVESLTVEESATNWGNNWEHGSDEMKNSDNLLYIAEVDKLDVIGLALAGPVRRASLTQTVVPDDINTELISLQVDPAWHRRGIGQLLVNNIASSLIGKGASGMLVKVLEPNPNVAFYESIGAQYLGEEDYDWEGFETKELIYGWPGWQGIASPGA